MAVSSMDNNTKLLPFICRNKYEIERTRETLLHSMQYKPMRIINFVLAKNGLICCFHEKTLYVTDGNLRPLLYYESTSYIQACTISDTGKYVMCQMAYNKERDADSGVTAVFETKTKKLICKGSLMTGWHGITHLFLDENKKTIFVYYGDCCIPYDFELTTTDEQVAKYYRMVEVSPYALNYRAQILISESHIGQRDFAKAEFEIYELLSRIDSSENMSTYQLSQTYEKLGDVLFENGKVAETITAYKKGLSLNSNLPVKRKLKQAEKLLESNK